MAEIGEGDVITLVRSLFGHPAMNKLVEVDTWAKAQGLSDEARGEFNRVLADLFRATPNPELVKEYALKMCDVFIDLGPVLMNQLKNLGK